jgi:hypothetical protein
MHCLLLGQVRVLLVVLPVPARVAEELKVYASSESPMICYCMESDVPLMSDAGGLVQHKKLMAELPPRPLPLGRASAWDL